jgi:hypothetical protein
MGYTLLLSKNLHFFVILRKSVSQLASFQALIYVFLRSLNKKVSAFFEFSSFRGDLIFLLVNYFFRENCRTQRETREITARLYSQKFKTDGSRMQVLLPSVAYALFCIGKERKESLCTYMYRTVHVGTSSSSLGAMHQQSC